MRADLHIHSTYSDGFYSPDEICRIAKERGLRLLSVTDHDTMAGDPVKREAAQKYGLCYLSGWEISAYEGLDKIHVLGYGCQRGKAYEEFLSARKAASYARAEDSVKKFRALGVPVSMSDVEAMQKDRTAPIHTMHVARAAALYLDLPFGEVYERYLNVGKPANSNIGRPSPKEAIDCIHALGGVASVAHPGRISMPKDKRKRLLKELADYGMDGIEAVYTTHTEEETEYFRALAKTWGLLVTGGSDTHVEDGTHAVGAPVFSAGEEFLERVGIKL